MFTISLSNARLSLRISAFAHCHATHSVVLSIFAFAHRHATHSIVLSISFFQFVPHVLIFSKFFRGSSKVGSFGYPKSFVVISHILFSMLEINVYSIIVFKVFGETIPIYFRFAKIK